MQILRREQQSRRSDHGGRKHYQELQRSIGRLDQRPAVGRGAADVGGDGDLLHGRGCTTAAGAGGQRGRCRQGDRWCQRERYDFAKGGPPKSRSLRRRSSYADILDNSRKDADIQSTRSTEENTGSVPDNKKRKALQFVNRPNGELCWEGRDISQEFGRTERMKRKTNGVRAVVSPSISLRKYIHNTCIHTYIHTYIHYRVHRCSHKKSSIIKELISFLLMCVLFIPTTTLQVNRVQTRDFSQKK